MDIVPWQWHWCARLWSYPRAVLCWDQQISADQSSLRCTVRPDYLLHYENGPSHSLRCWRSWPLYHFCQEGSQGQGRQVREMACWSRDLSLPQVSHMQLYLQELTAEPRGSIHAEFYRGWSRTFHASEDLICRKMRSSWSACMPSIRRATGVSHPRTNPGRWQLQWRFQWRVSASPQDLSWWWRQCWNTTNGCWTRDWRCLHGPWRRWNLNKHLQLNLQ